MNKLDRPLGGIHHVTAISRDPQRTVDFYAGTLGLRLVKRTVNYDAPGTYHLYFGDDLGRPGTILTYFPWPRGAAGRSGVGLWTAIALSVPRGALEFWRTRLARAGAAAADPVSRFGEQILTFRDPDGLPLELVPAAGDDARPGRTDGPVPPEHAVRGVHGATLTARNPGPAHAFLTEILDFRLAAEDGRYRRYATGPAGAGTFLNLLTDPAAPEGAIGVGAMHHVAWRTPGEADQRVWRQRLDVLGHKVTPIIDRLYFHSIYFQEPGGAIFEIATDPPGFTVDEPPDRLGEALHLPPWLDDLRERLERELPPLQVPAG